MHAPMQCKHADSCKTHTAPFHTCIPSPNPLILFPLQIAEHVLGQHRYRVPGDDGFTTGSLAQDRCV